MSVLHYFYTCLIPHLVQKVVTYTGPKYVSNKNTHTGLSYGSPTHLVTYSVSICVLTLYIEDTYTGLMYGRKMATQMVSFVLLLRIHTLVYCNLQYPLS